MSLKKDVETMSEEDLDGKYVGPWYERKGDPSSPFKRRILRFDFEKGCLHWQDQFGTGYCSIQRFCRLYEV